MCWSRKYIGIYNTPLLDIEKKATQLELVEETNIVQFACRPEKKCQPLSI
jgi:hypothetical protein